MINRILTVLLTICSIGVAYFLHTNVEVLRKGGPIIIPIILCSIFGLSITIEKKWQLHKAKAKTGKFMQKVVAALKQFNINEATQLCDSIKSPLSRILKAGITRYNKSKEEIRQAMEDASLYETPKLEKNLIGLATVAHIAPLLGLLGTVTGLVKTFQAIQLTSSSLAPVNPGDLAGGIWESLITTVAGLTVAIPMYVIYNYLVGNVNSFILEMEQNATEVTAVLTESKKEG